MAAVRRPTAPYGSFAEALVCRIEERPTEETPGRLHLFLSSPDAVAFDPGGLPWSFGRVQLLYEHDLGEERTDLFRPSLELPADPPPQAFFLPDPHNPLRWCLGIQEGAMKLDLEFVTPCFLGGAGQQAEWRAASVRGQLRWWFRAVAGGTLDGDLDQVRSLEGEVFGTTRRSSNLRVRTRGAPSSVPKKGRPPWGRALREADLVQLSGLPAKTPEGKAALGRLYLPHAVNPILYLGYGCVEYAHGSVQLTRSSLAPEGRAQLDLTWRRPSSPAAREMFDQALEAWLLLGGIGSRSRRGFGSLRLVEAEGWDRDAPPATRTAYLERVRALLAPAAGKSSRLAEWSHLSSSSRVAVAREGAGSWDEAMVLAGAWLMAFRRRYGYPGEARTAQGHSLADRDYVWAGFKKPRPMPPAGVPDRAGFGLPLPFGKPADQIVSWGDLGDDHRRASPLLLHVARLEDRFYPVFTHLPARLVPPREPVRFKGLGKPAVLPTPEQLSIVDRFLDDLARPPKKRLEVLP